MCVRGVEGGGGDGQETQVLMLGGRGGGLHIFVQTTERWRDDRGGAEERESFLDTRQPPLSSKIKPPLMFVTI